MTVQDTINAPGKLAVDSAIQKMTKNKLQCHANFVNIKNYTYIYL